MRHKVCENSSSLPEAGLGGPPNAGVDYPCRTTGPMIACTWRHCVPTWNSRYEQRDWDRACYFGVAVPDLTDHLIESSRDRSRTAPRDALVASAA